MIPPTSQTGQTKPKPGTFFCNTLNFLLTWSLDLPMKSPMVEKSVPYSRTSLSSSLIWTLFQEAMVFLATNFVSWCWFSSCSTRSEMVRLVQADSEDESLRTKVTPTTAWLLKAAVAVVVCLLVSY